MSQADTPERILNAAEELFARQGYHCTSLRAITAAAQANLAAVNYHFGSKEALLEAVLRRRLVPLNALRAEAMNRVKAEADAAGVRPEAKAVLHAFIAPTVRFCCSEPGPRNFSALVGRAMAEPDATVRDVFIQLIQPLFAQLLTLLQNALPQLPPATVYWRLQYSLGATIHMMRLLGNGSGFMPQWPDKPDTETLIAELVAFVAAGTESSP